MNDSLTDDDSRPMIVRVVSNVLERLMCGHANSPKSNPGHGFGFLKFQSSYAPEVSIEAYLTRIQKYSRCSDACIVMALVYIDRLIEGKSLILTNLNVHRLLITSVMLAAKFHDDLFYNNAYYSKLGGISLQELNHLEIELLQLVDNSLFVSDECFSKYIAQLQNFMQHMDSSSPAAVLAPSREIRHENTGGTTGTLSNASTRIPSPDNPHAAFAFGEYSPCRIGPCVTTPPLACTAPAVPYHQQQAVFLQKYYSAGWSVDPCHQAPNYSHSVNEESLNPSVDLTYSFSNEALGLSSISHGCAYRASSIRDLGDDATTTSCSTRTCSPYAPAAYSRSSSAPFQAGGNTIPSASTNPLLIGFSGMPDPSRAHVPNAYGGLSIETDFNLEIESTTLFNTLHLQPVTAQACLLQDPNFLGGYGSDLLSRCSTLSSVCGTDSYAMSLGGLTGGSSQLIDNAFSVDDTESAASEMYIAVNNHHSSFVPPPKSSYFSASVSALSAPHPPSQTNHQTTSETDLLARYQQCSAQCAISHLYSANMGGVNSFPAPAMHSWF